MGTSGFGTIVGHLVVDDQLIKHKSYDVFELWNCGNFTSDCDDTNSSNNIYLVKYLKFPKMAVGLVSRNFVQIFVTWRYDHHNTLYGVPKPVKEFFPRAAIEMKTGFHAYASTCEKLFHRLVCTKKINFYEINYFSVSF